MARGRECTTDLHPKCKPNASGTSRQWLRTEVAGLQTRAFPFFEFVAALF